MASSPPSGQPRAHNLAVLPAELLLAIWHTLATSSPNPCPADHLHLLLTCRRFHSLFLPTLYRDNSSSALFWACETGVPAAARHALNAGADCNAYRIPPPLSLAGKLEGTNIGGSAELHLEEAAEEILIHHTRRPNTPLSTAALHRHLPLVTLLLSHGADPNQSDGIVVSPAHHPVHQRVWSPLHWAIACGSWSGGCFFLSSSSTPSSFSLPSPRPTSVPCDQAIVRALLAAGADPNAQTLDDPLKGRIHATHSHRSDEAEWPLHMALCTHCPHSVVQALLEAGAAKTVNVRGKEFGCRGYRGRGMWTSLGVLDPARGSAEAGRDEKMVALLRYGGADGRGLKAGAGGVVDGEAVPGMFACLSAARVQVLEMILVGQRQCRNVRGAADVHVKRSGVYALREVWSRERASLVTRMAPAAEDGSSSAEEEEEALAAQRDLFGRLEALILFLVRMKLNGGQAGPVDDLDFPAVPLLDAVWADFCNRYPRDGPVPVEEVVDLGQYDREALERRNRVLEQIREPAEVEARDVHLSGDNYTK
jgi:hypothetical protein